MNTKSSKKKVLVLSKLVLSLVMFSKYNKHSNCHYHYIFIQIVLKMLNCIYTKGSFSPPFLSLLLEALITVYECLMWRELGCLETHGNTMCPLHTSSLSKGFFSLLWKTLDTVAVKFKNLARSFSCKLCALFLFIYWIGNTVYKKKKKTKFCWNCAD